MNKQDHTLDKRYALGHTHEEIQRLQRQDQFLKPATRKLFEQAGITPGMKVLDIGSGAGDVSLLLAEMVGPGGRVLGIDANPATLSIARARAQEAGFSHVTFREGDIQTRELADDFDAIVGRFILVHLSSPAQVLRRLAHHLRPGGIVAFLEPIIRSLGNEVSFPPFPLYNQTYRWMLEAFRRAGAHIDIDAEMARSFLEAGLPEPQTSYGSFRSEITGRIWTADKIWFDYVADLTRSLLPLILEVGLATEQEVGIETLSERLYAEAMSKGILVQEIMMMSGWTHKI